MKKLPLFWLFFWFSLTLMISPQNMNLSNALEAPSFTHFFGTDALGRDLLKTTLLASQKSALFALGLTLISSFFSFFFSSGMVFLPTSLRFILERILDFFLAFPGILIALTVQTFLGKGWVPLFFSALCGLLPGLIRYLLTLAKEVVHEEYVNAGIALGAPPLSIMTRHLFPALLSHLLVKLPFFFASALLLEATLSFLNLGAPPGNPTWGSLLLDGKNILLEAPQVALFVGLPLVLTIFSLQILADYKK